LILDLVNSLVLNLLNRTAELCDQTIVYANSSRRK
jgi:predicted ABC-type ATPase